MQKANTNRLASRLPFCKKAAVWCVELASVKHFLIAELLPSHPTALAPDVAPSQKRRLLAQLPPNTVIVGSQVTHVRNARGGGWVLDMAIGSRCYGSEDGPADILYNGTSSDVSDGGDAARRPRRLLVYRSS